MPGTEDNGPVALRRTPRRSAAHTQPPPSATTTTTTAASKTPGRGRKRVRFSDPGPLHDGHDADADADELQTTGLTPLVRRTTLTKPRRRHSTPAPGSGSGMGGGGGGGGEVRVLALAQVLDGRVVRRIRRNGLSEEMHVVEGARRRRAREAAEEVARLRGEVSERDAEIARLRAGTGDEDGDGDGVRVGVRVRALEREVEGLREALAAARDGQGRMATRGRGGSSSPAPSWDWTVAGRDPFRGHVFMDLDVDDDDKDAFGETTMAELACSTPSRRGRNGKEGGGALATPPTTSPASAPWSPSPTPRADAAVQAALPDAETDALRAERASLQRELATVGAALDGYTGQAGALADTLAGFDPAPTATATASASAQLPPTDLAPRLQALLARLSDRTAALVSLTSTLGSLGFPGATAPDMLGSLTSALRAARLELEYVAPGECTLPLTSAGAALLDGLLARLRGLAARAAEADARADAGAAREGCLRAQLAARVDAMDAMGARLDALEGEARRARALRDATVAERRREVERLDGALRAAQEVVQRLRVDGLGLAGRGGGAGEETA